MNRTLGAYAIMIMAMLTGGVACAQTCTQTLRLANETYNAGRLHELPKICEKCLDEKNADHFTSAEMVTAYKLLTQAYIYLEEPEAADKAMLNLLNTDGFFEINEAVDPAEFIALYKKFRTRPVISIVGKFGFTFTFANPISVFNTGNSPNVEGKFDPSLGLYYGLGVEKIINKRFTFAPEVLYLTKSFKHSINRVFDYDNVTADPAANISSIYTHTRIDFYPMLQYKIFDEKKRKTLITPFVAIGPGFSYLAKSESEIKTTQTEVDGKSGNTVSGPIINTTTSFNQLTYSVVVMAGGKLRIGSIFVFGDARFQYGFSNVTNVKRSNAEALFDYGYQIPDFSTHNLMLTIGAIKPIFIPKKLIK